MISYIFELLHLLFLSLNFNFFLISFLLSRYFTLMSLWNYIFTFLISLSYITFFNTVGFKEEVLEEVSFSFVYFFSRLFYSISFICLLFAGILFLQRIFSLYTKLSLFSTLALVLAMLFIVLLVSNTTNKNVEIIVGLIYFIVVFIVFFLLNKKQVIVHSKPLYENFSFQSFYRALAQVPILLTAFFPIYFLQEHKDNLKKFFLSFFLISLLYYSLSFFFSAKFNQKVLIGSILPQLFLQSFKDHFYICQIINIFLVIMTIIVICRIYVNTAMELQKLISVFNEKKIFSEIFIFLLISGFLCIFYKRFLFFASLFGLHVICISFASLLINSKEIWNGRSEMQFYFNIIGNTIAIIISLFDIIFLKF